MDWHYIITISWAERRGGLPGERIVTRDGIIRNPSTHGRAYEDIKRRVAAEYHIDPGACATRCFTLQPNQLT